MRTAAQETAPQPDLEKLLQRGSGGENTQKRGIGGRSAYMILVKGAFSVLNLTKDFLLVTRS